MEAIKLKQIDRLREHVTISFINRAMNATDKNGKFKIKKEEDLFNLDKEIEKILRVDEASGDISELMKIANNLSKYRAMKGQQKGGDDNGVCD